MEERRWRIEGTTRRKEEDGRRRLRRRRRIFQVLHVGIITGGLAELGSSTFCQQVSVSLKLKAVYGSAEG